MTYLARLKQIKSGPALPEMTEPPSGGFGSVHSQTFSGTFVHTDTLTNQGETVCGYMSQLVGGGPHVHLSNNTDASAVMVTEPTKHPSGGFVTTIAETFSGSVLEPSDVAHSLLRRKEDEALVWVRRFLQYDTVPIDSVEAAARLNGLSWLIVKRVASHHVIEQAVMMHKAAYWKLPKTLGWQPDDRIE